MVSVGSVVMPVGLSPYAKGVYSRVNLRPGFASDCLPQRDDERWQPDAALHDRLDMLDGNPMFLSPFL
jgi:hypothetical protein